jgi:ribosome recycling factor
MAGTTFQEALEIVESLPQEQRKSLMEIVKRRLTEERRDQLAQNIKSARDEYKRGRVRKGTVDDLMNELEK